VHHFAGVPKRMIAATANFILEFERVVSARFAQASNKQAGISFRRFRYHPELSYKSNSFSLILLIACLPFVSLASSRQTDEPVGFVRERKRSLSQPSVHTFAAYESNLLPPPTTSDGGERAVHLSYSATR